MVYPSWDIDEIIFNQYSEKDKEEMKQYLEEAPVDGYRRTGWMIVDGNNFIVAGEQGMSLTELNDYFAE